MEDLINRLKERYKDLNINTNMGVIEGRKKKEYYKKILNIEMVDGIYIVSILIWRGGEHIDTKVRGVENIEDIEEVIDRFYK